MVTATERSVSAWRSQVDTNVRVAGSGPPVVFLHGAFGLQWDPFLDALAERYTVYAPEHPGTSAGKPDEIKPIDTLWDLVLYYYELFDALQLDAPAVIGHSFGAMVAAEVAATNPARVGKLVLIAPVGLWREDAPVRNWMTTPMAELPKHLFADQSSPMALMMSGGATAMAGGEIPDAVMDMQLQMMWSLACTGKFVWPIPDKGLKKRLHRITAPTLIVQGKQDGIVPAVYAVEFASKIAGSKTLMVDGAGHLPQVEQQETVVAAINEFLGG